MNYNLVLSTLNTGMYQYGHEKNMKIKFKYRKGVFIFNRQNTKARILPPIISDIRRAPKNTNLSEALLIMRENQFLESHVSGLFFYFKHK